MASPSPLLSKETFELGVIRSLLRNLPCLTNGVRHPMIPHTYMSLVSIIPDLNDTYGWTREQIANWLETLNLDLTFRSPDV